MNKPLRRAVTLSAFTILLLVTGFFIGRFTTLNEASLALVKVGQLRTENYISRDIKVLRMLRRQEVSTLIEELETWVSYQLSDVVDYEETRLTDSETPTNETLTKVLNYNADFENAIYIPGPNETRSR